MSVTEDRARENALHLMPELGGYQPVERTSRHRIGGWLAGLAIVVVLSVTFAALWFGPQRLEDLRQVDVAAARLPVADLSDYREFAAAETPAGWGEQPVVLTYHDVAPASDSDYVITPTAFSEQMRMLKEAGYSTITADEFVAYTQGAFTPPARSVLITFDDGTRGLWTYADSVLQRYGFTATSFIITGRVNTHAPYYLTWSEVEKMNESGRWSFQSHTRNSHTKIIDSEGQERSLISAMLPGETEAQFQARVTDDLQGSVDDFAAHGLPAPSLFAWPFSDAGPDKLPAAAATYTTNEVKRLFQTSFVDNRLAPRPVTAAELTAGFVTREEIFSNTSTNELFQSLQQMQSLPVANLMPLSVDRTWRELGGYPAPVVFPAADSVTAEADTLTYVEANWAPQRTSDWTDYTVSSVVSGLTAGSNGGLRVRVDHGQEMALRISQNQATITNPARQTVATFPLVTRAAGHKISISVDSNETVFFIDDVEVAREPVTSAGTGLLGGFGIVVGRDTATSPFPTFTDVSVGPYPASSEAVFAPDPTTPLVQVLP